MPIGTIYNKSFKQAYLWISIFLHIKKNSLPVLSNVNIFAVNEKEGCHRIVRGC